MDKATRNSIERLTQDARRLLEEEFRKQLEGDFDVMLDGSVGAGPGAHLSAQQRVVWEKLVSALAHKRAGGFKGAAAVAALLREAAFHTLNRFVALKMLEARQLVKECVSQGSNSVGFKEFVALAPGLVSAPDRGYRLYIESIFDELAQEVGSLFDRRDVASLLWPRRQALHELLAVLNDPAIAQVWGEDETIGWVYQYFNSDADREAARYDSKGKPKPPTSSYELAIRNQFFTPSYVVQFLTDNTLGRLWFEMMGGETQLTHLDYLVTTPADSEAESRPKKDPRDLRVLDPASGSGHFLLYAFRLLLTIYEEAWRDSDAAQSQQTGRALREDYPTEELFRAAVPDLILRHNLHGVDIDPRAAQIAALALWMRAQRAYNDLGISGSNRPLIGRTNVVVAEPIPGDPTIIGGFADSLRPPVLGQLFRTMVEEMELAGELGSMLKIEAKLAKAVRKAEESTRQGSLLAGRTTGADFWDSADERIVEALADFAASATGADGLRRRLFAEDAAQGVALIELLRKRFDVVVMNPPFGAASRDSKSEVDAAYPSSRQDLFAVFVERAVELTPNGFVGVLSTEAGFFRRTLENWRRKVLLKQTSMSVMAHLGGHVLDGATVRTAAYVLGTPHNGRESTFIRVLGKEDRQNRLLSCVDELRGSGKAEDAFHAPQAGFEKLPYAVFGYWCSREIRDAFQQLPQLEDSLAHVRQGLATADDFRFLRLRWEVPDSSVSEAHWMPFAKGGEYSPYQDDVHLLLNWSDGGAEIYAWGRGRPQNVGFFGRPGLTYPPRTNKRFAPRALPGGCSFGHKGPAIVDVDGSNWSLLALMNSRTVSYLLSLGLGTAEAEGGAGANSYEVGLVQRLPVPPDALTDQALMRSSKRAWKSRADLDLRDESTVLFHSPVAPFSLSASVRECARSLANHLAHEATAYVETQLAVDHQVAELYRLADSDWRDIEAQGGEVHRPDTPQSGDTDHLRSVAERLALFLLGCAFGRWDGSRLAETGPSLDDVDPFDTLRAPTWKAGDGPALLADDPGHKADLDRAVFEQLAGVPGVDADAVYAELAEILGSGTGGLRGWLASKAFDGHISTHGKSRRKAPLCWQLSTPSSSYSVWCYYPRLTKDSLFRALNDLVAPKVQHEASKLAELVQVGGPNPSRGQRSDIEAQERFLEELHAFQTELARVAPLWNPHFDDGVVVNFSLLWRLVPHHRDWQKECKKTWDKLEAGDYDWAHLAMHLWPKRVLKRCREDRSIAIAHGLEATFWVEIDGKWEARLVPASEFERLVQERSSSAVKDALAGFLSAPAPAGGRTRTRKTRRRASAAATATTRTTGRRAQPTVDDAVLTNVRQAIAQVASGASKADVLEATGISASEWNTAIKVLLDRGQVEKKGKKRGTRYHATGGEG